MSSAIQPEKSEKMTEENHDEVPDQTTPNPNEEQNQAQAQARAQEQQEAADFRRQRTEEFGFEQMLWNDMRLLNCHHPPAKPGSGSQSFSTAARSLALTMLSQNHRANSIGTVIPSPHPTHLFALYLGPPGDLLHPLTTNMSLYLIFWGGWGIPELVRRSLLGHGGASRSVYDLEVARREAALRHLREFGVEMFVEAKGDGLHVAQFAERVQDVVDEMAAEVDVEIGLCVDVAGI